MVMRKTHNYTEAIIKSASYYLKKKKKQQKQTRADYIKRCLLLISTQAAWTIVTLS